MALKDTEAILIYDVELSNGDVLPKGSVGVILYTIGPWAAVRFSILSKKVCVALGKLYA